MKPFRFANIFASAVVLSMAAAQAGTPAPAAPAATPTAPSNWATFTVGGAFVDGDEANYKARTRQNDIYGGISDFHYGTNIDNSTTLTLDGHALPGNEDYELDMLVNREGVGYIKLSYDQFRTWYDASGGYSPLFPARYAVPFDDERYINRGNFAFEAGLRMENLPEVTFRYNRAVRNGVKDSLAWGDSWPQTTTNIKGMPGLWNIDEVADIFDLSVEHTFGKTELEAGMVYEHSSMEDTRYTIRRGTRPNSPPTPTATGTAGSANETWMKDENSSDLFAGHVAGVTRFNDSMWLSYAASYSGMDTDLAGSSRLWGAYWALPGEVIPGANGGAAAKRDYAYNQMTGGSNVDQFIANLNFMWVPMPDLTVTPSLRYEHESSFTNSQFQAFNTNQIWQGRQSFSSDGDMDQVSEALDIRYKGIENIVLYATCNWAQEDESIYRRDDILPGEWLNSEIDISEQEYVLGANWYPCRTLSFGVQGLYENRDQSFDHTAGNQPKSNASALAASANGGANNLRPIMNEHETELSDVNLRVTWRPMSNLSFVTRYDYAETQFKNAGNRWLTPPGYTGPAGATPGDANYPLIQSGEVISNVLSETVTWTPISRMYVQGSVSWVSSETSTLADFSTPNSDNDYIVVGMNMGYALDDRTDITAGYSYYTQNNYATAPNSMGYGLETSEHMFNVGLNRMLTENMLWSLNYGYIMSDTKAPDQSGGFNDFQAHMISTGLQIRF